MLTTSCFAPSSVTDIELLGEGKDGVTYSQTIKSAAEAMSMVYENESMSKELESVREQLDALQKSVGTIREKLGIEHGEAGVEETIEAILDEVSRRVPKDDIAKYSTEVAEWLSPNWDKLEPNSKVFLPNGAFLFDQYESLSDADMDFSLATLSFCQALEHEMFRKVFFGYSEDLIRRRVSPRDRWPRAFRGGTRVFAEFLDACVAQYPENPERWRFEMGKMSRVLERVLDDNARLYPVELDFRQYLDRVFEEMLFEGDFVNRLVFLADLRNKSAHPDIVLYASAVEGKELVREKLNFILAYYR